MIILILCHVLQSPSFALFLVTVLYIFGPGGGCSRLRTSTDIHKVHKSPLEPTSVWDNYVCVFMTNMFGR